MNKLRVPVELHDSYTRCPGATYWIPRDPEQKPEDAALRMQVRCLLSHCASLCPGVFVCDSFSLTPTPPSLSPKYSGCCERQWVHQMASSIVEQN